MFLADPKVGHEALKRFRQDDLAEFLRQAIRFLENGAQTSFAQVVQQFCQEDAATLPQMLFTADLLSLEEAAQLLRIHSRHNPDYQVNLMETVRREIDEAGPRLPQREMTRLLEILAKSMEPDKVSAMLASLCEHPDERLRSKVAVLSGVVAKHLPKRLNLLKDVDPRVRANAVEGLWGKKDAESMQLLIEASADEHHRVAANGLLGRHLAGDLRAVPGMLRLMREAELPRQLAGVWAMGETGDPRFYPVVNENLVVRTGRVKFALLSASRKIRKCMDESQQGKSLQIELLHSEREEQGRVRLHIQLQTAAGEPLEGDQVKATQVVVHDGDLRIDMMRFHWRGVARRRQVALLVPLRVGLDNVWAQQIVSAVEGALGRRKEGEEWCIAKYDAKPGGRAGAGRIAFSRESAVLRDGQLRSAESSGTIEEAFQRVVTAMDAEAEERRLVVLLDAQLGPQWQPSSSWQDLLDRHQVSLSVVNAARPVTEVDQELRQIVHARRGTYHRAAEAMDLAEAMDGAIRCLGPHYYLTYQLGRMLAGQGLPENVTVEIYQPRAYGRMVVDGQGQSIGELLSRDG